jgi:hypothetical protein
MKRFTSILALAAATVAVTVYTTPAYCDDLNKATTLTVSQPIRLPGVTLPAGSYVFEHPTVEGDRHVVQVFSQDHKKIYATLLTIPNERMAAADVTVVTFREMPTGSIDTVKAWFYPGEKIGDEFIYPEAEAREIAKATHGSVLTDKGRVNEKGERESSNAPKK